MHAKKIEKKNKKRWKRTEMTLSQRCVFQKIIGVYQKSSLSAKVIARDKYIRRSALGPNLQKTKGANKNVYKLKSLQVIAFLLITTKPQKIEPQESSSEQTKIHSVKTG